MCEKLSESQIIPSTPHPTHLPGIITAKSFFVFFFFPRKGMPNPALLLKTDFAAKQIEVEAVVNAATGSRPSAWKRRAHIIQRFTWAMCVLLSLTNQVKKKTLFILLEM